MSARRAIRDNGLSLAFLGIFLLTLVGYLHYISSSSFLVDVAENWQSEFLAVGAMVTFAIFLRQRGSSESKPVGTPHHTTSVESE